MVFLPLHDDLPIRCIRAPYIAYGVIGLCAVIAFVTLSGATGDFNVVAAGLGMIPSVLIGPDVLPEGLPFVPEWLTPATSIFIHAGLLHLIGNMLFLWVLGDNVEDAMGHLRFALFFLICGIAGALAHAWMNPGSQGPLVGASGAISGVIASYLILHPKVTILGVAFKYIPLRLPAWAVLGTWALMQLASGLFQAGGDVGWWAHVGGLVAGAALTPIMVRRDVRLFGRGPQPC